MIFIRVSWILIGLQRFSRNVDEFSMIFMKTQCVVDDCFMKSRWIWAVLHEMLVSCFQELNDRLDLHLRIDSVPFRPRKQGEQLG